MKNFCIFVSSNSSMRGVEPATQGGFFCVPAKGFSTYKRRPAFTESPVRGGNARASGLLDSGIVRAAFLFAQNVQQSEYAHSKIFPSRAGNPGTRRKADHPASFQTGRNHYAARFDALAARMPALFETPKRFARTAFTEVKTADYPPIFSTQFVNLQCINTL